MDRNYYMVRAMNQAEKDFKVFFENSVVAVGWSEIEFTSFKIDETDKLMDAVANCYYSSENSAPQFVGKKLNQVRRFTNINTGDCIIIPYNNSIRLAIAEEKRIYSKGDYDADLANQRKVSYQYSGTTFKTIPRDELSEALQRRLRVRGSTVSDLYEFTDEIETLFSKSGYSWTSDFEERENKLKKDLTQRLINIKEGSTHLKTGGIGLENLVKELFECEEYKAEVLAKTAFTYGDADVHAVKSDKFRETKILIQVKHHNGYTNDWGLNQLNEIKKSEDYKYSDYKFVLITSADIDENVRKKADELGIVAMDGNELSDWIIENLNKLSVETKIKLGISAIPQLN